MSDERLETQLVAVEYEPEEVETWARKELLTRMAVVIASGTRLKKGATNTDPETEKENTEFEQENGDKEFS